MASTYGHLDTLLEYDRSLVVNGPSRTNPALMPLAIPSAPGAVIALSFAAKACSITLADGGSSSLDALGLAARAVRAGRAQAIVVVGAASLFDELVLSLGRAGQARSAQRPPGIRRRRLRHGARRKGAAALVLESAPHAAARHREPKAFVTGQASTFAAASDQLDQALARAGRQALAEACLTAADLGLVASGASGVPSVDTGEARALLRLLGHDGQARVTAVKSALGETIDASGLLAAAAALASLGGAPAGPIVGLERPAVPGLRYLTKAEPIAAGHALVTATSQTGACSALVLSKDTQ